MKRFMVREARAALPDLLDAAERGEPVVIERRGVLFTVSAGTPNRPASRRHPATITRVDASIDDGTWTWEWSDEGLVLKDAEPRR
jgi:antitoxin (DNA-binding transcriptional repressor) of toxin-antitoxin stability system